MTSRPRLLRRAATLVAAVVATAGAVFAFDYFKRPGGYPYIWPTHWTTMYASNSTLGPSSSLGIDFRSAANQWNNRPASDFRYFVNDGFHDAVVGDLDGFNDVYFSTSIGYSTLGITYTYYTSDNISLYDCDVAFNGYMYNWYPGYYDFASVAVHELGHVMDLAHVQDPTAVMYPTIGAGQIYRVPNADDLAGEAFLYPKPVSGGGGGGGGGGPPPLPVRAGMMVGLTVSSEDVRSGDPITFSATVTNNSGGQLLLSSAETTPVSLGTWTEVVLQAGESRPFTLDRIVLDLPGLYPKYLRLGGLDPTMVYLAQEKLDSEHVRVRRAPIAVAAQDTMSASLGPNGDDRVEIFLVKGAKILLDCVSNTGWEGARSLSLSGPEGTAVPRWVSGKALKAKQSGAYELVVTNVGEAKGSYHVYTTGLKSPPPVKAKGALDGAGPAEIPFVAMARTGGTLQVKGSKSLAAAITSLRSPTGRTVAVTPGASVEVDALDEDGTWTAIVGGAEGKAGKVSLLGKMAWIPGVQTTK
jgi:hypothetical protein